ncbi:hypothetical protein H6S82_14790 [Planktothrix sp. FACHB-1355]|uniref:DUF6745 domain-containing protein n=1 Tax=Aerosakkonema funiforme FACHB-1375 TaxID=2949571 RepID=A0A926VG08_9CYAN|nr:MULTISPECIES: hypothetical protein [Oscillatoriales]MBD2183151.1 hypothetical protein [Aerosakkonema funiforme FACHB-1375]MBD3560115.1 hypothetical protein [Planktothrix sp. FACHB-1355]
MSQKKIEKLTPEQEALIPVYGEKWRNIVFSTDPIDRSTAKEAIKKAYVMIGRKEPEVLFFDSTYTQHQKWEEFIDLLSIEFLEFHEIMREIENQLWEKLIRQLSHEINSYIIDELQEKFFNILDNQIGRELANNLPNLGYCIIPEDWAPEASYVDFCLSVLNLNCSYKSEWLLFQEINKNCGIIFPYEELVMVCDRPRILSFDNQHRLHAEGAPAIQFADGYSLYAYHGVPLPEKYGKVHPNNWQSAWLLEEENAELRRVLIQAIGYEKIASELGATELDSFQEYSLLKINTDVDIEPIYMLKMTCPSTGYIHILRVPPDLKSAREAICWVNWGVDPEEFGVQT